MSGDNVTPRETVGSLDRYIIGQDKAKRAVAVALRNRWRRQQVDPELRHQASHSIQSSRGERNPPEPMSGATMPSWSANLGRGFFIISSIRVQARIAS